MKSGAKTKLTLCHDLLAAARKIGPSDDDQIIETTCFVMTYIKVIICCLVMTDGAGKIDTAYLLHS